MQTKLNALIITIWQHSKKQETNINTSVSAVCYVNVISFYICHPHILAVHLKAGKIDVAHAPIAVLLPMPMFHRFVTDVPFLPYWRSLEIMYYKSY